jgi:hypothetical protein
MSGFSVKRLREVLKSFSSQGLAVAVETGVWQAKTTAELAGMFREVHGVELSEEFYSKAHVSLSRSRHVSLYCGDSAEILPMLAKSIREPALFYLDAHWFPREGVADSAPFPLWAELSALKARKFGDLIIVDDVHAFGRPVGHVNEWNGVSHDSIVEALGGPERCRKSDIVNDWCVVRMKEARV